VEVHTELKFRVCFCLFWFFHVSICRDLSPGKINVSFATLFLLVAYSVGAPELVRNKPAT